MFRISSVSTKQCFFIGVFIGLLLTFKIQDIEDSNKTSCGQLLYENQDTLEFEPQLNLAGKPMQAKKTVKNIIRPRYYTSELGIREKLFVAVLAQVNTIETISTALNKTTAHLVDRIKYFINADNVKGSFRLKNIVGFTDTRENLRTYHALKYIADNYVDDFDYFLLMPDSAYVNARLLMEKLNKISISSDLYMGKITDLPGSSYDTDHETSNGRYCDINAGIILSNSVVKKIRTNLDWCVRNAAVSNWHSTNLGKCIKYASGISECQTSWQNVTMSSYKLNNYKIYRDLHYLKLEDAFNKAVIVYPITNPDDFYLLHTYFSRVNLEKLHEKIQDNLLEYQEVKLGKLPDSILEKHWPIGVPEPKPAETRHDLFNWDLLNETHIFMWNSEMNVKELHISDQHDLDKIINRTISYTNSLYPELSYDNIHSAYRKFDPVRGMDYILHLNFRKKDKNNAQIVKSFEVVKPLGSVEIVPVPYVTESTKIVLVMPVFEHQNMDTLETLDRYEKLCMATQENTFLMLVFLYGPESPNKDNSDVFLPLKSLAKALTEKHKDSGSRVAWLSIRLPVDLKQEKDKVFNSIYGKYEILSLGIVDLALRKIGLDSLILVISNALKYRPDFLNRVRMNTIQGYQVYNPVGFVNYPCKFTSLCRDCDACDVAQASGYFDSENFDIISFYSRDYVEGKNCNISFYKCYSLTVKERPVCTYDL